MEYKELYNLLHKQIEEKPSLEIGFQELSAYLRNNDFQVNELNLGLLKTEFNHWLITNFKDEPLPSEIQSLYFGLVTTIEGNTSVERTTIHLNGSRSTPIEDEDWACDFDLQVRNRYLHLTEFQKIDKMLKNVENTSSLYEIGLFVGILNLLIFQAMKEFKNDLFKSKQENIYFGSGYDSGDLFNIGKLSSK